MFKTLTLLAIIALTLAQQNYDCYPTSTADGNYYYVSFQKDLYKYSKHDLKLIQKKTYNVNLCAPATIRDGNLIFAGDNRNSNRNNIRAMDLAFLSTERGEAPYGDTPVGSGAQSQVVVIDNNIHTFVANNGSNYVSKRYYTSEEEEIVNLQSYSDLRGNVLVDPYVPDRVHVLTQSCMYRGCDALKYYRLQSKYNVFRGSAGVLLNNTFGSGCPVQPSGCGVPVLLSFRLSNDVANWVWSIATDDGYKVYLENYDAKCNTKKQVLLGESLAAAPRCTNWATPSN
ncbi:proline tRS [Acrasis kona]|uniref:Proline tRS n=1 Tax=Acrasis kona TaxID=1008807 RepID=A0AAW2YL42_9EUKA